ncbi:MAG: hypothetical protein GY714_28455 [Desulfobacterales bacterium]|nr:hypothetical protein [Desulfobacterales bacterium]
MFKKYLLVVITLLLSSCMTMELQDNSKCILGDCHDGFSIKRDRSGIYIGHLKNEKKNGKGSYKSNFGYMYIGHWKNDLYHGEGKKLKVYNFFSKEYYDLYGQWKEGRFHGKGKVVFIDGTLSGLWREGKPVGKFKFTSDIVDCYGEYTNSNDPFFSYKDLILLTGKISWADGSKYIGKFGMVPADRDNSRDYHYSGSVPLGEGIYINSEGVEFKGIFKTRVTFFLGFLVGTVDTEKGKYKYTLSYNRNNAPVAFKFKTFEKIEETVD